MVFVDMLQPKQNRTQKEKKRFSQQQPKIKGKMNFFLFEFTIVYCMKYTLVPKKKKLTNF